MTFAKVLTNVVLTCSLEFAALDAARVFGLANPMTGKDMAVKVCSKCEGIFAFVARIGLQVGILVLAAFCLVTYEGRDE